MWRSRRPNAVLTTSAAAGRCIGLLVLLACLCPSSFVSSSGMSGGPRVGVTSGSFLLHADQPDYWDQVYKLQGEHGRALYEWYGLGYQQLRSSLMELLEPLQHSQRVTGAVRLLVLGSGDSALSAELASDKALQNQDLQVFSIDFSAEVTERMRQRFPKLTFLTMDARNMSDFDDGFFVAAIDKGLSDCLGTVAARRQYFQEVRRVLVASGRLLVVSQRRLWAGQDSLSDGDEEEEDSDARQPHSEAYDLGPGWSCDEQETYGPLFMENDPKQPPFPQPGTEGTIPYFVLTCSAISDATSASTGGAGVGLLFILPRLLATLFGAPRASPLPSVLQDVAVNFGAMVFCGFLTYQEWNQDSVRSQAKEEGALIARLPIQVPMDGEAKVVEARLSDLRVGRQMKSRRPVLCLGNLQFCRDCISAAMEVQEAMTRCDFLLVPVLYNSSAEDASSLAEAAKDLRFVALPGKDPDGDWAQLSEIQLAQVRSQGLDEAIGQAIIIKKNGRVGTRFLGVPEWKSLTAEVDARVKLGLDTRNV
ncbi:eef1aknmt [Symbiodinium natans]|uniref:Eef1aknmt protein n=1 Tax=Symbiodinium natans TaxID=878477 RepID=A0A812V707_9DINO|nr:eef1aknmt [Symbiodinium natans]